MLEVYGLVSFTVSGNDTLAELCTLVTCFVVASEVDWFLAMPLSELWQCTGSL